MEAVLVLLFIAAIFASITSLSEEGKLPAGYNKEETWRNKYTPHWLPFRTTIFVFTTDLFHFAQFVYLTSVQLAMALSIGEGWNVLYIFAGIKIGFSLTMEITRRCLSLFSR